MKVDEGSSCYLAKTEKEIINENACLLFFLWTVANPILTRLKLLVADTA